MNPTHEQLEAGKRLVARIHRENEAGAIQGGQLTEDDALAIGAYIAFNGYDGQSEFIRWCRSKWIKSKLCEVKDE